MLDPPSPLCLATPWTFRLEGMFPCSKVIMVVHCVHILLFTTVPVNIRMVTFQSVALLFAAEVRLTLGVLSTLCTVLCFFLRPPELLETRQLQGQGLVWWRSKHLTVIQRVLYAFTVLE